jgi:hypothetical protein
VPIVIADPEEEMIDRIMATEIEDMIEETIVMRKEEITLLVIMIVVTMMIAVAESMIVVAIDVIIMNARISTMTEAAENMKIAIAVITTTAIAANTIAATKLL